MKKLITTCIFTLLLAANSYVLADNPKVRMETTKGTVLIELYTDKAPGTVENFLRYVNAGKYDGTIFHRVIKDFMNQGGGFTPDFKKAETFAPIQNEADNGLKNTRGTLAMARTGDPHSATNQFFINTADNAFLDHTGKTMRGWGYCVFGTIVDGMDVMDRIAKVQTGAGGPFNQDVPQEEILIQKISVIEKATKPNPPSMLE
ncbi:MAG: peptidyl-prolyl cis-trans isomerase [Gammaproteobacteria bacterium]|nr:peptidyl-prolyl cis-trans isomerase [Gammaproteobacteria bacterium]